MAGRLAFHFIPGSSLLHRWDTRCKLPALVTLSVGLLHMNMSGLAVFSFLLALLIALVRIPWLEVVRELRIWGLFLIVVFLVHAVRFSSPGHYAAAPWLPVDEESLTTAALTSWRMALILCYSLIFMLTTRSRDIQDAILWALRPIPYIPTRRIATMMSLTLRFIPIIMDQAQEVQAAVRCRGGNRRRSPVFRMKSTALPVLRRTLLRADELALALGARGYREDIPVRLSSFPAAHAVPLILLAIAVAGIITRF